MSEDPYTIEVPETMTYEEITDVLRREVEAHPWVPNWPSECFRDEIERRRRSRG